MKISKNPSTGIYSVAFKGRDGKGHVRSTKTTNRDEAIAVVKAARIHELELAAKANALNAEALTAIMAGRKMTAAAAAGEWIKWLESNREPTTAHNYATYMAAWLGERYKSWPVSKFAQKEVDEWVNDKGEATASTRRIRLRVLRGFFDFCTANGYRIGNPARLTRVRMRDLSHEQKEPKKRRAVTLREYRKLVAGITDDARFGRFFGAAVPISYWCGLRLGDIAELEWASITPTEIIVWTDKVDDRRVALPLSDPLIGSGELQLVMMDLASTRDKSPYVFPNIRAIHRDPQSRAWLSVAFGRLCERLAIEGVSFHCLRHSFVTRLKHAGKTIEDIGRLVGHASISTTEVYLHAQS